MVIYQSSHDHISERISYSNVKPFILRIQGDSECIVPRKTWVSENYFPILRISEAFLMVLERDFSFSLDILSLKSQSVLLKAARRESSFQISRAQLIKLREDKRS